MTVTLRSECGCKQSEGYVERLPVRSCELEHEAG